MVSYGFNGRVTDCLTDLVENQWEKIWSCSCNWTYDYDEVYECMLTKELGIKTTVSLNPIMVDGTGMCGACRVTVGNEVKFACVDGPEFDGHLSGFWWKHEKTNSI